LAREKRIICEGTIYHITSRGNNRDYIFSNPKHKAFLLKQIKEYNMVFDFELLAYVIMDNHYHLLIYTNKTPISKLMFSANI
jgi:REP element-mobilizing transposase RayT